MAPAALRPLDGRVAVITGGTRGVGRAIALRLAREGAHCAITYRQSADRAAAVVEEIEREGIKGLALRLELQEPSEVPPVIERIGEALGRVDILVANAVATAFRPLADQREHNVRLTFAISVDSFHAMPGHGLLGGAKAAVESLVRSLALELGPEGITVNGVNPGMLTTESSKLYLEQGLGLDYDAAMAAIAASTPVRRIGTVEDVADCVAWIVSDGAGFLTGQTIVLDGGLTIVSPLARLYGKA